MWQKHTIEVSVAFLSDKAWQLSTCQLEYNVNDSIKKMKRVPKGISTLKSVLTEAQKQREQHQSSITENVNYQLAITVGIWRFDVLASYGL